MSKQEILVAFSGGGPIALGNIWRITAKNTDFYIDPVGEVEVFHVSVHGPNDSSGIASISRSAARPQPPCTSAVAS